jgi:hypothetical protein
MGNIGFYANDNEEDLLVFMCGCGSCLFLITKDGPKCDGCGEYKSYQEVWG